jgi:hypothetical protein
MGKIYNFVGGRKWILAIASIVIVELNPTLSLKTIASILAVPSLFIIFEGLKDIKNKQTPTVQPPK